LCERIFLYAATPPSEALKGAFPRRETTTPYRALAPHREVAEPERRNAGMKSRIAVNLTLGVTGGGEEGEEAFLHGNARYVVALSGEVRTHYSVVNHALRTKMLTEHPGSLRLHLHGISEGARRRAASYRWRSVNHRMDPKRRLRSRSKKVSRRSENQPCQAREVPRLQA
jgi:hypothetical protein